MGLHNAVQRLGRAGSLDRVATPLAGAVTRVVRPGALKDALTGKALGHPLHPMLTDLPIGALTSATVLDLFGGARAAGAADALVAVGVAAVAPTALAGATDWSDTYGADQRIGVVHALANTTAAALYVVSLAARLRGRRTMGKLFALGGLSSMTVGGYLGGHLSYSRGIGVNNTFFHVQPDEWTSVLADADLAEGTPTTATVKGTPLLLYRASGTTYAVDSRCTHAGGPLEEGDIDRTACTVRCPWHGSVFRLADGSIVRGPASSPEPAYDVRTDNGGIEVRYRR